MLLVAERAAHTGALRPLAGARLVVAVVSAAAMLGGGCDMGPYKPEYDEGFRNVQGLMVNDAGPEPHRVPK